MRSEDGLRILFVINGFGTGGAERSLGELLPQLSARGIDPIIVCLYHREQGVERQVLEAGFDIRFLRARHLPGWVRELRTIAAQRQPDLIHTTIFESDLVGRLVGRGGAVPVLTSLVNTSYDPVRLADPKVKAWRLRLVQAADGWTARRWNTHFHAITDSVKEAAVRDLGIAPERVTVVPRGRDPVRLGEPGAERRRLARERLDVSEEATVVLNVGRQEYQKGQRILLEAAALLVPRHPELVFLIAGRTGNKTNELLALHEKLRLGGRVRFLGYRDDVPDLLAAADVFALPSLYEGLGGAVIEAMALAAPIVASDLPPIREVVGSQDVATLVPPNDPAALSRAVAATLADGQAAARRARAGRVRFLQRFTIQRVADEMVAFYDRATGDGRSLGAV